MAIHWNKTLLLGAVALAAVGCKNGEGDDTGDTQDTQDTQDTSPTYLQPYWFQFAFFFGYHVDSGQSIDQFVTYQADDNGTTAVQDPAAVLVMFEDDAGALGDEVCTVIVQQAGPITPGSLNDSAVKKGFLFDWDTATIQHDCDGLVDPALWGEDISASLKTVDWGVGLTGLASADVKSDWLDLVDDDENWTDYMAGARPYLSTTGTFKNSSGEFYFARGTAMDTDTTPPTLLFDDVNSNGFWEQDEEGIYLLATDVAAGPVTGGYVVSSPYVLNFGETLDGVFIAGSQ